MKPIQRWIVSSEAFCQSSALNAAAAAKDRGNRLLWRKTPSRLEAESLRDAMLVVAGEWNPTMGGPGYQDFQVRFLGGNPQYETMDPIGDAYNRRTIYRTWVRGGGNRFLDVFDCPDPSTTTPRRMATTTPLQALANWNNQFVLRMSDRWAERLTRDAGREPAAQIVRAYELAYGRSPTSAELERNQPFVSAHGLAAFCRVIFNSSEFLYVD
jgi:hypothetical protein